MKMPRKPPNLRDILTKTTDWGQIQRLLGLGYDLPTTEKYPHWDILRHLTPPEGFSHEEWWAALKLRRQAQAKPVPLTDPQGNPFTYSTVDPVPEMLQKIDQGAGGFIRMPDQVTNPETRDQYYVNSLIQEAITSSQLEGAATTRSVAKEMIRTGRPPRDKSEQMILNNFRTMQWINALKDKPLSTELVFEIHRIITEKTLEHDSATGRFRLANERIVVGDMYGEVFHSPPPAEQLRRAHGSHVRLRQHQGTGGLHPSGSAFDHPPLLVGL